MQALVLAGGEGTRLRPLTATVPKPVLPLANRPFITYMMDWLAGHGFDDIVMSCGFLADGVRSVLGDGRDYGVRIRYVDEPEPRGTAGAVKFAQDMLGDRFAVLNGDVLTDFDLSALLGFHLQRDARGTIALIGVEDPSAFGLVKTAPGGEVQEFLEKPPPGMSIPNPLINAGAYILEHDVLDRIADGRPVSFEREVFPGLVGEGLYGFEVHGYWLDIGTPERYLQATSDILAGVVDTEVGRELANGRIGIGRDTSVEQHVRLRGPVVIGERCELAGDAELGPYAVLGDDCRVAPQSLVRSAVLFDGAEVEPGAIVRDSIIGAGARVLAGARVEDHSIVGDGAVVPEGARIRGERVSAPSVASATGHRTRG